MSTRLQLFVTHLFAILVPLAGLAVFLSVTLPARYVDEVLRDLRAELRLMQPPVERQLRAGGSPAVMEGLARQLAETAHLRITLIDRGGRVLAESERDPTQLENHASRPEFQQALESGEGTSMRHSKTLGIDMLYAAIPVSGGQAVLRVAAPLRQVDAVRGTIRRLLLFSVLGAALLALALATFLARRLTLPLTSLQRRVERIAGGEMSARARLEGSAETRRLGSAINAMAARLHDLIRRETEDRSRYQTILAQMADGIVITDPEGRIELFNPAASRLLEVSPETVQGRNLLEATLHPGLAELLDGSLEQGRPATREIRLTAGAGCVLRVHAAPVLGERGRLAGGVLVLQDLTEARRLEEMRRDFVANVSHELKTPVTAVRALAETLVLRGQDRPQLARDFAGRIAAEAERMSRLLADLLDLAAIEAGRRPWRPEWLDLEHLLRAAAARFQDAATARGIHLVVAAAPDLLAWGDAGGVEQVVGNLIDNAIKYCPRGTRVTLSSAPASGEVLLTVADTGPGISPEAVRRIFERFYRADAGRGRGEGGTGLGLAIARHLVESQGGRIWAESAPGAGSRFSFTLPAGPPG